MLSRLFIKSYDVCLKNVVFFTFGVPAYKNFSLIWLSNLLTMIIFDEVYSRNASLMANIPLRDVS